MNNKTVLVEDDCGNFHLQFESFDDFKDPADDEYYMESLVKNEMYVHEELECNYDWYDLIVDENE